MLVLLILILRDFFFLKLKHHLFCAELGGEHKICFPEIFLKY